MMFAYLPWVRWCRPSGLAHTRCQVASRMQARQLLQLQPATTGVKADLQA
jgi:hypothetical protein